MPSLPLPTSLTNHARWPSSEWTMTWYIHALSLHQIYFSRPATKPTFALKIERALCLRLQSAFIPTICWPTYRDLICQTNSWVKELPKVTICCRTFLLSYTLCCAFHHACLSWSCALYWSDTLFFPQDAEVFCSVWGVFWGEPSQTIPALSEQQLDAWLLPHRLVNLLLKSLFLLFVCSSPLCFFSLFWNQRGEIHKQCFPAVALYRPLCSLLWGEIHSYFS